MVLLMLVASVSVVIIADQMSLRQTETRLNGLAETGGLQVEDLLWQYDSAAIELLLTNLVLTGALKGALVSDGFDLRIEVGDITQDDQTLQVSRPLTHVRDGSVIPIGLLYFVASTQQPKSFARQNALTFMLISSLTIFLAMVAIFVMLDRRIARPIIEIERGLKRTVGITDPLEFRFRQQTKNLMIRELGVMVDAIQDARLNFIKSQSAVQEKQKQLQRAAEIARLGYGTISVDEMRFIECDANLANMLGLSEAEVLNVNVSEPGESLSIFDQTTEKRNARRIAFSNGQSVSDTFTVKLKNGDIRDYRVILEPVGIFGEPEFRLKVVMLDVTELRRSEERAHQAEKLQTIGKLTGGVAHDFNNILAIISGNLELIQDACDSAEVAEMTQTALDAVSRGARVTQQLLAFARKQPLSPIPLDASRLVKGLKPMLMISIGPSIDLEIVSDSGQWLTEVDPTQLEACILNLVVNARDAMPNGGKLTLEVGNARIDRDYARAHTEVEAGQYVCVSISDTGTGMPPEVAAKVFEPFFTTKPVGKGTGLGLSMVFGFAKQSGGHAKVYSEVGIGTIVKLYLPRAFGHKPVELTSGDVSNTPHELLGLHVLLIEDEADLLVLYAAQLKSLGCTVETARSGPDALALVGKIPTPDLILTDIILPGQMNGRQIADALHKHYPKTPVIYMSGYTENAIIHDGKLDAGSVMLQKPFTLANLAATLSEVLKT